jgi:hypothetical protein
MYSKENKLFQTPILFLIFNRLETTKLVFERIKSIKPAALYIACDGPRETKSSEQLVVKELRDWVINSINWECEYKLLFRETNLGCGLAVSSAIDWFFQHVEMGIILEDDCLVDHSFFQYSEELLWKYKDDPRISCICSSNTIEYSGQYGESYFFSKYSLIWGWASWRRAWKYYDFRLESWPELKKSGWLRKIDRSFHFRLYWTHVFDTCFQRKVDTWDFQWTYACWLQKGLSIIPNTNLVRNIGIGISETHNVPAHFASFKENMMSFPLLHPIEITTKKHIEDTLTRKIFSLPLFSYIIIFFKKIPFVGKLRSMVSV